MSHDNCQKESWVVTCLFVVYKERGPRACLLFIAPHEPAKFSRKLPSFLPSFRMLLLGLGRRRRTVVVVVLCARDSSDCNRYPNVLVLPLYHHHLHRSRGSLSISSILLVSSRAGCRERERERERERGGGRAGGGRWRQEWSWQVACYFGPFERVLCCNRSYCRNSIPWRRLLWSSVQERQHLFGVVITTFQCAAVTTAALWSKQ